jgi:hypothetical protein
LSKKLREFNAAIDKAGYQASFYEANVFDGLLLLVEMGGEAEDHAVEIFRAMGRRKKYVAQLLAGTDLRDQYFARKAKRGRNGKTR